MDIWIYIWTRHTKPRQTKQVKKYTIKRQLGIKKKTARKRWITQ